MCPYADGVEDEWFNAPVTDIFYSDLSLDQLHAIGCNQTIRDVTEREPLSPVSADNAEKKIEGLVTQPRSGLAHLFHRPTGVVRFREKMPANTTLSKT